MFEFSSSAILQYISSKRVPIKFKQYLALYLFWNIFCSIGITTDPEDMTRIYQWVIF